MSVAGLGGTEILLTGFAEADLRLLEGALGAVGRKASGGDPVNDEGAAFVLAASYDEAGLRSQRAAALEDERPWCFCVPAADRALVAAAALASEGLALLLPPESRELRRVLSALADAAQERAAGSAAYSGLDRLEADFAWRTRDLSVSRSCRSLARLLADSGFYASRAEEDECALALEEALVNAIEHGNLELDSSLRPDDPADEDRYETERERRLEDPAYGGRMLRMSLSIGEEEAVVVIEDEGPGFDPGSIDDSPSGLEVSGKGFWLIKQPFDDVSYNSKGNALTLRRRRPRVGPKPGGGEDK